MKKIALANAVTQLGSEEQPKGSNSGPQVNQYLAAVGLAPGYAWCMAFVYWCVQNASKVSRVPNLLVKTGGVAKQWNETTYPKLTNKSKLIKAGDIFIMQFAEGGHTGFVKAINYTTGTITTIEGNTNDGGSREGYKVAERQRKISSIKGFIQLP